MVVMRDAHSGQMSQSKPSVYCKYAQQCRSNASRKTGEMHRQRQLRRRKAVTAPHHVQNCIFSCRYVATHESLRNAEDIARRQCQGAVLPINVQMTGMRDQHLLHRTGMRRNMLTMGEPKPIKAIAMRPRQFSTEYFARRVGLADNCAFFDAGSGQ